MLHRAIHQTIPLGASPYAAGRRPSSPRAPMQPRRLPPIPTHRATPSQRAIITAPDAAAGQSDDDAHKAGAGGTYSAAVPDAKAEELSLRSPEARRWLRPILCPPRGIISAAKAQTFPNVESRRIAPGHCTAAHHRFRAGGTYSRTRLRPERRRANGKATPIYPAPAAAETPGPSGQEAGQKSSANRPSRAGFHPFRDAAHGRPAGGHPERATRCGNAACHHFTGDTPCVT